MSRTMNVKNKLYQDFVVDKIKNTDWDTGTTAPLVVEFDTTEVCNLACPGCIGEDLVCNKTSFTRERLLTLAEEMSQAGVKAVILIGGGEPLAHPGVGEFIQYLGEHDVHIGITTNGTFIDRYLDIIAAYSSWTRVSIDAATEEGFQKLRPSKSGGNEFSHVIANMKNLAEIKRGTMGFSFLIRTRADGFGIESNVGEIFAAACLAREIGCDYFEVKPSYSYIGGQAHALVKHDKNEMERARGEIAKLNQLETDTFKIIKAINLDDSLNCVERNQDKSYTKCPVSELRTLICPSGVYICPYWRGKENYRIGDVHETSFLDMWNSQRRKQVAEYANPSTNCRFHCLRHESNQELMSLIQTPEKEIEKIKEYDRFI